MKEIDIYDLEQYALKEFNYKKFNDESKNGENYLTGEYAIDYIDDIYQQAENIGINVDSIQSLSDKWIPQMDIELFKLINNIDFKTFKNNKTILIVLKYMALHKLSELRIIK